jgi:hypothetical protein
VLIPNCVSVAVTPETTNCESAPSREGRPQRLRRLPHRAGPLCQYPPGPHPPVPADQHARRPLDGPRDHARGDRGLLSGPQHDARLHDVDHHDVLQPITAYYVMRIGRLPLVPYFPPGDTRLAEAVRPLVGKHHAVLLANHGPVVAGTSLSAASGAIEELEETARLFLMLQGHRVRHLTPAQVDELRTRFG